MERSAELNESAKELLKLIVETVRAGKPTIKYLKEGYALIYPIGGDGFFTGTFKTKEALEAKLEELEKEYRAGD